MIDDRHQQQQQHVGVSFGDGGDWSSYDVLVSGLTRDGATSWIASLDIPALGVKMPSVYLQGATEEEAYKDAGAFAERTRGSLESMAQDGIQVLERMGEQVRVAWVEWARQQPEEVQRAHPNWLTSWGDLDAPSRSADVYIALHLMLWLDGPAAKQVIGEMEHLTTLMRAAKWKLSLSAQTARPEHRRDQEPTDAEIIQAIGEIVQRVAAETESSEHGAEEQEEEQGHGAE